LYAYCGFPRSLNAINTFKTVIEERKAKGVIDSVGKQPVVTETGDKYERGRQTLEKLTGTAQVKPAPGFGEFAPRIDKFLKEHLFADIFDSNVLSYQQRELVTIAALAAMPGVQPQLQAHLSMGKNTGLTADQYLQVADLVQQHIGVTQANMLRQLLGKPVVSLPKPDMMVRIAEIEILPEYLKEYIAILKEEAAASVKLEPGVIAIFPMYRQQQENQIRILEIYASEAAYQSHLKTAHFQHYKTATLKMVKSLQLVDMHTLDKETMLEIFEKLK
jgi:4-carboxymuconolactone decarboxylase